MIKNNFEAYGILALVISLTACQDLNLNQKNVQAPDNQNSAKKGPQNYQLLSGYYVTTLAGGQWGFADGKGSAAKFKYPGGSCIDQKGNLYVADYENNSIRRVSPDGTVTTIVGKSGLKGFSEGAGDDFNTKLYSPVDVAIDKKNENLYIAEWGNHAIRKYNIPTDQLTTLAGTGIQGYKDGPGYIAQFNTPLGIAVDLDGWIVVADAGNYRIRKFQEDGVNFVFSIAGNGASGYLDGPANKAKFGALNDIEVDEQNNYIVTDGHYIRKYETANMIVSTVTNLAGSVIQPGGLGIGKNSGIYYASENLNNFYIESPFYTRSDAFGYSDGKLAVSFFYDPVDISVAEDGSALVSDVGNYAIRKIYYINGIPPSTDPNQTDSFIK